MHAGWCYPMGAEILETEVGHISVHFGRKFVIFGNTHSQGMWAEAHFTGVARMVMV